MVLPVKLRFHEILIFPIRTGEIGKSIENSLIMFKANEYHKAVTQTDTKIRINININYL